MMAALRNDDAIEIASRWITASNLPYSAALISGSAAQASPKAPYDPASDVDCYLVVDGDPPDGKIGKATVDGVLLDVSWLPWQQLESTETNAVFASLIQFGRLVRDSDGRLVDLKERIDAGFESPDAIAARLEDMRGRIRSIAQWGTQAQLPQPEQVMNWIFPATLATHIPLIKACAPLTVRKRFVAAKRVMGAHEYEQMLALFGFDSVTAEQAQSWLDDTATLFEHTGPLATDSDRFWASDIQEGARAISIGGSQKLIDEGFHREALYWIVATRARCLTVMHDVGADTTFYMPAFEDMTNTLGVATEEQRAIRSANILEWIEN